jgi:hypothetical protein
LDAQADKRSEGRSNVFLAATLDSGAAPMPVRIRNLSTRGALIEADRLPALGTAVRLTRGSLSIAGELAWQAERIGGVNFVGTIEVASWVQRIGHSGQQRVDGVIAAIRRLEPVPAELQEEGGLNSLTAISAALDQLCDRLAGMPDMSLQLGEELVRLDTIAQSLRHLATGRKA